MIEIYEGESPVSFTIPLANTVVSVVGLQTLYDAAALPVEEEYSLTFEEVAIDATYKDVIVDVSALSEWPTGFRVQLTFLVGSVEKVIKADYAVVTPYVSVASILEAGGFTTTDSSSPRYRTYSAIRDMEAVARHVVEGYTGRFFGRSYSKAAFDGSDLDRLYFDQHVVWLGLFKQGDDILYSSTVGEYVVSPTGHVVSILDDSGDRYGFPTGYRYEAVGIFGEPDVPYDVELATKMLAVHYLCADSAQQNAYVDQVKFGESATRTNKLAFTGTGLLAADRLLEKYRFNNLLVI